MKLRAYTLLETLVSMALIGGLLAVSMLVYAGVLSADRSSARLRARIVIDSAFARIMASGDPQAAADGTSLEVEAEDLPCGLKQMTVRVVDGNGRIVLEASRIMQGPWRD